MKSLVWAGLFLVLVIVGSGLGAARMVGMPITALVEASFGALMAGLAVWGIVLFAGQSRLVPALIPVAAAR